MFPIVKQYPLIDIEVDLNGDIIKSKITDKEESKELYEDSIAGGDFAVHSHYDKENPDMLNFVIGQFKHDSLAKVTIKLFTYLNQLSIDTLSFYFP